MHTTKHGSDNSSLSVAKLAVVHTKMVQVKLTHPQLMS